MGRIKVVVRTHIDEDNATPIFWLGEPAGVPNARDSRTLDDDVGDGPFGRLATAVHGQPAVDGAAGAGLVRIAGEEVYRRLTIHPGVRAALEAAEVEPPEEIRTLHVCLSNAEAENIPWEAIFLPNDEFAALSSSWRLARVVEAAEGVAERVFDGTLRMVAILGAADRYVELEWQAMLDHLTDPPVPIDLLVLTCKKELRDEINALGLGSVRARLITNSVSGLLAEIESHGPQLLHVFSHGTSEYGGQLVVSHRGSEQGGDDPLFVSATDLQPLANELWLVCLNTCRGAESVDRLHSLASSLVSKGVPSVVAMREAIDSADAHEFCGAFLGRALETIHQTLEQGGTHELEWDGVLRTPRVKLSERHPGPAPVATTQWKAWSVPVLYRRPKPLLVENVVDELADIREDLEFLRSIRADLHPDTSQSKIEKLDARIAALEAQL